MKFINEHNPKFTLLLFHYNSFYFPKQKKNINIAKKETATDMNNGVKYIHWEYFSRNFLSIKVKEQ